MTRLTVLGGSAAGVGTGQGCAGFLVQSDTANVVLDMGPGTLLELRKHADFRALDGIVVSHLHMDHILDLFALRFALAYNPERPPRPVPLWLPPGGLAFFERSAALFATEAGEENGYFSSVFDLAEYDPAASLRVADLTLTFAPTVHPVPCWAIRVHPDADDGDVLYTADTGAEGQLDEIAAGAAVVIAEATFPPGTAEHAIRKVHLTPRLAGELADRAGARHLVLTHMWEELGPERFVEEARAVFTGRLTVAFPGLSFAW
jgi:ribonuclease BN (tRNA processing enzyme)